MIQVRLNNCKECGDINQLIKSIDCKVFQVSKILYQNITLEIGLKVDELSLFSLLQYKRILQYKLVNPEYAKEFSVKKISNKVNILKYK